MAALADDAAALFGVNLSPQQVAAMHTYAQELSAWNQKVNLTAITDPEAVRVRHFLDSLSLVRAVAPAAGQRWADVGSGAGFPGLPLLIAFPGVQVTLIEATGKKVTFMQHIIATLGLTGALPLHARAEDAGQMPDHRAVYDVVVARAVARLPVLLEYLLPLAKVGGLCIAMKGSTAQTEITDSRQALRLLGGRLKSIIPVALPGVDDPHNLIVIEKIRQTPPVYPRKAGMPAREPL